MLCILKALFAWALLVFLSMNLFGFVVRGLFWSPPQLDAPTDRVREIIDSECRRMSAANIGMTLLSIAGAGAYLFILNRFWGLGLAAAGFILMLTRLPDLLWEIRTGTRINSQNAPRGVLFVGATVAMWATLPLIWYSLCK